MVEIKNNKSKSNPSLDGQRNICQRRASTISNMIEEAKKRGLDETFARDAIYKYGNDIAKEMKEELGNEFTMDEFIKVFASYPHVDIYEMELVEKDEDHFRIYFNYCPYVEEWIKQGYSGEDLSNLCDITMEGDRAIGESFEDIKFTLGKTIADGNNVCDLMFEFKKGEKNEK